MKGKAIFLVMALAMADTAGMALAQHMSPQSDDPQRWSQPNMTPMDRHKGAMKEAAAALKEALDECRSAAAPDRTACISGARAQQRIDIGLANARLAEETSAWRG
jgi:hypothetical protein